MKFVHILERICFYIYRGSSRSGRFLMYVEEGMRHGYPLCCIVHFAWNLADPKFRKRIRLRGQVFGQATQRGAVHRSIDSCYVPCWFHLHIRRSPNWRAYAESPTHHPFHPKLFHLEPQLDEPPTYLRKLSTVLERWVKLF